MNPLASLCCLFRKPFRAFLLHKDCISFNFLGNWAKKIPSILSVTSKIRACRQRYVNQMCVKKEATV